MDSTAGAQLSGQVGIVTGSSRGIGRAVATALVEQGAAIVVNGRDASAVERAAAEIRSAGGRCCAVSGSPSNPDVAQALVAAALDGLGRVDILVNCVGTAEPAGSSILDVSRRTWDELIDSHLNATFEACRAVAPHLVAQRHGAIVNTSSHAALGLYGGTGYPAGKGAITSLTLAIAAELKEHGVRANVICPGARTRLSTGDEYERHVEDLHARGLLDDVMRTGSLNPAPPEHVAALYAFLVSDLAAEISGEVFVGAGGYIGRFPRAEPTFVAWRDHDDNPPWTLEEIAGHLG